MNVIFLREMALEIQIVQRHINCLLSLPHIRLNLANRAKEKELSL